MNALLLIILLSNGGYWFDGPGTITVNWAGPEGKMPASSLMWQLSFGAVELASGQADIKQGARGTSVTIDMPATRTATEFTWHYQLKETSTGKLLEEGSQKIRVFPRTIL